MLWRFLCHCFRKKRGAGGSDEVDAPPAAKKSKEEKKEEKQLKVCLCECVWSVEEEEGGYIDHLSTNTPC